MKKKTEFEFIEDMRNIHGDDLELLGKYTLSKNRISVRHKCGYVWNPVAITLYKYKCPKCSGVAKKTHEEYLFDFKNRFGDDFDILNNYSSGKHKILIRHNICSHEWNVYPSEFLLYAKGCPKCFKVILKTHETFLEEIKKYIGDEIIILGQYHSAKKKILVRHSICGSEWEITPDRLLTNIKNNGTGCLKCIKSKGEKQISNLLTIHNVKYIEEYKFDECRNKRPLPFDFAIFKNNTILLIEYDGEQHFRTRDFFGGEKAFNLLKTNDNIKNEYCKSNNIKLIRIPYWNYKNIEGILTQEQII